MNGDGELTPGNGPEVLRPSLVRTANASAIMQVLLRNGAMPRTEIAALLGLTQGPVTRIVARLMHEGLVHELDPLTETGARGRPRVPVQIVPAARHVLGLHIGLEHITAGWIDLTGNVVSSNRLLYDGSIEDAIARVCQLIDGMQAGKKIAGKLGACVIIGGWVDTSSGVVVRNEQLGWHQVPLQTELETRLQAARLPIQVEGNVRAHACADLLFGRAKGYDSFVHVFVGNVFEAAVVWRGSIMRGKAAFGGDLAHWLVADAAGRSRPAADVLIDPVLVSRARTEGILPESGGFEDLVELARSGRTEAIELLADRARQVGTVVAEINALLGPQLVVVSSGVLAIPEHLKLIEQGLGSGHPGPDIVSGDYSQHTLIRAAGAIGVERFLADPLPD